MAKTQTADSTGLFGLSNCNKDLRDARNWGKNIFNSTFPTALVLYMDSLGISPVYLKLGGPLRIEKSYISVQELFGLPRLDPALFFAFSGDFAPYRAYMLGDVERTDLVTQRQDTGESLVALEIKLTAIPDETTSKLKEASYSAELVVRAPTIEYLAMGMCHKFRKLQKDPKKIVPRSLARLNSWTDEGRAIPHLAEMADMIDEISGLFMDHQSPLLMQPIWKTEGKKATLTEDCLDVFVWSDFAFTRLFLDSARRDIEAKAERIQRPTRALVWVTKMMVDFSVNGKFASKTIIDELTYKKDNDKAFSLSGTATFPYLECPELKTPRVKKSEIKNIVIGGGQNLLSPERRFDAVLLNTPEIFD